MANDGAADPDALRAALVESEVAEHEGFDDELVEDIVEAVRSEAFDRGWIQHEHDASGRYQRLRRVKHAAAALNEALDATDPADLRELTAVFRHQRPRNREQPRRRSLVSVREDVGRLADAVDATKHSGGRPPDPSKRAVGEVARAVKRFGDERQEALDDGELPPLRQRDHLVLVVREVLDVLDLPTSLSDTTIVDYARRAPDA